MIGIPQPNCPSVKALIYTDTTHHKSLFHYLSIPERTACLCWQDVGGWTTCLYWLYVTGQGRGLPVRQWQLGASGLRKKSWSWWDSSGQSGSAVSAGIPCYGGRISAQWTDSLRRGKNVNSCVKGAERLVNQNLYFSIIILKAAIRSFSSKTSKLTT